MTNNIVLPEGELVQSNEADRPSGSMLKVLSLNLASLPRKTSYGLQDGIVAELCARKGCAIQILREQNINMEQISLQHDELVLRNQQLVQVINDACNRVPALAIPTDIPTEVRTHRLAVWVHDVKEVMAKVRLELNIHIVKLQLKAQPSTTPEVRE